jgi:thymidylate synthase (FAD)
MQTEIKVLDHGYVRYIDHMGSDLRIVEAARVSYRSPSKGDEADKKLLEYLWKNKHTSPFEMCKITLNIKMPIFVMRQCVRHRMQNLNEVSARYTELPNEFYIPINWRAQDTKNKQGSNLTDEFLNGGPIINMESQGLVSVDASETLQDHCNNAYRLYKRMLEAGIAKEMARFVLPVNIYTECYSTWDLKNLIHFITLRDDSHAQAEIQEYGKAIKSMVSELFPWTMEAYNKFKFVLKEV